MQIVLLSGGSGKRLWPITGEQNAKQFLRVLPGENDRESMLERACRQLRRAFPAESITAVTGAAQRALVVSQLRGGAADVLAEPERRNTFPAIALACVWLSCEKKRPHDEMVLVLPVDFYVEDDYFDRLALMEAELQSHPEADVVLLGTRPAHPTSKYGYILPESATENALKVLAFREKPEEEEALALIAKGALWNCGVFAFRLGYILDELARRIAAPSSYAAVLEQYAALEKNSIDRVLLERGACARVLRYDGRWMDLGTWETLFQVMDKGAYGKVQLKGDCKGTVVLNTTEEEILINGLKDALVVKGGGGVRITGHASL